MFDSELCLSSAHCTAETVWICPILPLIQHSQPNKSGQSKTPCAAPHQHYMKVSGLSKTLRQLKGPFRSEWGICLLSLSRLALIVALFSLLSLAHNPTSLLVKYSKSVIVRASLFSFLPAICSRDDYPLLVLSHLCHPISLFSFSHDRETLRFI